MFPLDVVVTAHVLQTTCFYVCGPMTGIQDHNYPAFEYTTRMLRTCGAMVISPHELNQPPHDRPWEYYMRRALDAMLRCNAIVRLPGWDRSRGASLESELAHTLGYAIYDFSDGKIIQIK